MQAIALDGFYSIMRFGVVIEEIFLMRRAGSVVTADILKSAVVNSNPATIVGFVDAKAMILNQKI